MDSPPPPDLSQTHPYTCNACAVAFRSSEAQRNHMRSDWHRYNLKRKVAELPSVSSEDYNIKVLAAQASTNAVAAQAAFNKFCDTCEKHYFSQNAYRNHILSQKHKLRVTAGRNVPTDPSTSLPSSSVSSATAPTPQSESVDSEAEREFEKVVDGLKDTSLEDEEDPLSRRPSRPHHSGAEIREEHPLSPAKMISPEAPAALPPQPVPLSRCLFCNYDSPTWKLSIAHMTKIHGLFIPEQNYLTDLEGLLGYLQAKIHLNHECLFCHKLKTTTSGVQTHMRDKGHCKIAFETEEEMVEVGQFYDFSSTYSDPEAEDSDTEMEEPKKVRNGGVKLPNADESSQDDDGWETDSSFSSLDSNDLTSVPNDDHTHQYQRLPLHRHHSQSDPRPHKNADGWHSHAHHHANAVFYDEHEMYLPSGRIAGHRSLKKYYRQNLHSYPTAAERTANAQRLIENRSDEDEEMEGVESPPPASRHQALTRRGEAGMIGATASQRQEVRSQEIRGRQQAQRIQNRYQARVEKQANSQKHFRDPLLQ